MLPLLWPMGIPTGQPASKLGVPSVASASNLPVARSRTKPNSNQQLHCHPPRLNLWPLWTWDECVSSSGAFSGILTFLRKPLQLHTRKMMAVPRWATHKNPPLALATPTLSILPYAIGSNGIFFSWKGSTCPSILQTTLPKFYHASFFIDMQTTSLAMFHQNIHLYIKKQYQHTVTVFMTFDSTSLKPLQPPLPPVGLLQLLRHGYLYLYMTKSKVIHGSLSFGMSDTIHTYVMDCGGVLVYT
jgi:hypothetical protein